jgi:Domain of unknown function (DUF5916)/Carbohydrate family 9 binding domain-like
MLQLCKRLFSSILSITLFLNNGIISGQNLVSKDTAFKLRVPGKPRIYNTIRLATAKPVIDGKLDDDCWKTGEWAGDFTQFVPSQGGKPSQPTEVKILYDDENIYVAIRAFDSEPGKIQKFAGLRDDIIGDEVGVTFDSYHDHRTGFEFDLTAYGQKVDLILTNPMSWDVNWNPVWYGKVGFEDSAWVAEMRIPLSQLRYSNDDEQVWGLHVWRWINRLQEESDWEIQSLTGPGVMYYFGELHGIKGLKKSQRLEIMPYSLAKLSTSANDPTNPFTNKGRLWGGNAGLDAKVGLGSNFTIDLSVNPDFGQVESDPSVMNLTAFETLYEEKRPFFLEGKNIYSDDFDGNSMFYSRRIGHSPSLTINQTDSLKVNAPDKTAILSAIKLSGITSNGLSVAILQSLTASEYAQTSDLNGSKKTYNIEPLTNYLVARILKDYNTGTTMLGGIFTSTNRMIDDSHLNFLTRNVYTGGLDLLHQWKDKEFFIEARLIGSYAMGDHTAITYLEESSARYFQRPDAHYLNFDSTRTTLSGYGGKLRIGKGSKGFWRYDTGLTWMSPGLELNDLGYMQITDLLNQDNNISYFVNQPVSIFRTYTIGLEEFNQFNFNGDYLLSGTHLTLNTTFTNMWNVVNNLAFISPSVDPRILRGGNSMKVPGQIMIAGLATGDITKKLYPSAQYEFIFGADNYLRFFQFAPGVTYRPINTLKFNLSVNYSTNRNDLQYVSTLSEPPENRYILGQVDQKTLGIVFRIDYNITPQFSIQFYGSPFVSTGMYSNYKYITNPLSSDYNSRFRLYNQTLTSGNTVNLNDNGYNISDEINNPNFNFHQFRSNLVAKWEYRPGSLIYLVWSSDRTGNFDPTDFGLGNSMRQLAQVFPNNIFLIKFSYWFSL